MKDGPKKKKIREGKSLMMVCLLTMIILSMGLAIGLFLDDDQCICSGAISTTNSSTFHMSPSLSSYSDISKSDVASSSSTAISNMQWIQAMRKNLQKVR
jgi:hypothetical protein